MNSLRGADEASAVQQAIAVDADAQKDLFAGHTGRLYDGPLFAHIRRSYDSIGIQLSRGA